MQKNHNYNLFRKLGLAFLLLTSIGISQILAKTPAREYYQLRIYQFNNKSQQERVENYLQNALLPALHRIGINKTAVMRTLPADTTGLKVYVLIPFKSMEHLLLLPEQLQNDKQYQTAGNDYLNATYDNPPYKRYETVIMKAFVKMPEMAVPKLKTAKSERIYELRSYESPTEERHLSKVKMFNESEINIFKQIDSNPVFWGDVISGSHMPNLMYLTTYANKADREDHWKVFKANPDWKKLSAMPEYQKNVSHSDILFLQPTDYSDL
ncbi:MAG: NIPSNAP family protein [Bacteroidota bacterium]|nr:NIPSNAP family protein [Bacteroidota bacterium]